MQTKSWKLLLQIGAGILLNILASYFLIPRVLSISAKHYSVTDIYMAIYVGLILSAVELVVVWIGILLVMK